MANALYDKGREGFLDGTIDWDTNDIRVCLVKSTHTPTLASDTYMSTITAHDNGRSAALATIHSRTACRCSRHGISISSQKN